MEIKCQQCSHIGAPSSIVPTDRGISLICSQCGHANIVEEEAKETKAVKIEKKKNPSDFDSDEVFRKFLPEEGDGFRCPKCLALVPSSDGKSADLGNCPSCGLDLHRDYSTLSILPWERPPKGKESDFDQALLLWKTAEELPDSTRIEKFVNFTDSVGLHDLQIRKLRKLLVSHPGHVDALNYLRIQSKKIQSRVIVAQTQSESQSDAFGSKLAKARQRLLYALAVALVSLIIFFADFIYG